MGPTPAIANDVKTSGVSVWGDRDGGRDLLVDQVDVSETDALSEYIRLLLGLTDGAATVARSRRYVLVRYEFDRPSPHPAELSRRCPRQLP